MTPAIEILVAARELLGDESRWTRDNLAHDVYGVEIDPRSKNAVCWCVMGAVQKFSPGAGYQGAALSRVHSVVGESIDEFNDNPTTTHADVLRVLDAAIERAKQDG